MKRTVLLFCILLLSIVAFSSDKIFSEPKEHAKSGKSASDLMTEYSARKFEVKFLYDLSNQLHIDSRDDEARRYILEALEIEPSDPWLLYLAGDIYHSLNNNDSAQVLWEQALATPETYEFITVWKKLVDIAPRYYINLGLLYYEKGKELDDENILKQAEDYLNRYITQVPDGVLIDDAKATINEIKLLYKRFEAQEISAKKTSNIQKKQMERRMEIRKRREEFRTKKRRLVGLSFYSFKYSSDIEFEASKEVLDEYKILELKDIKNPISQYEISGGYIYKEFFFKGGLVYANNSTDHQFVIDTVWSETQHKFVDVPGNITNVRTILLGGEADYNFFFVDPLLFYAGGSMDMGSISIIDDDSYYDGNFLFGVGMNLGLMLHFNDFLIDLSYKRNLVGSSSGSTIRFGAFYKF